MRGLRRAVGHRNPNGGNDNNQHKRQINAIETEQASIPGEVSISDGSILSQAGCAGDAFVPRQGSVGSPNTRSDGGGGSR